MKITYISSDAVITEDGAEHGQVILRACGHRYLITPATEDVLQWDSVAGHYTRLFTAPRIRCVRLINAAKAYL